MDADFDKAMGYIDHGKPWSNISVGLGSSNWDATERAEPSDSLGDDPDDPKPDQRVDSAGYQRWRRRQQKRIAAELRAGLTEHKVVMT